MSHLKSPMDTRIKWAALIRCTPPKDSKTETSPPPYFSPSPLSSWSPPSSSPNKWARMVPVLQLAPREKCPQAPWDSWDDKLLADLVNALPNHNDCETEHLGAASEVLWHDVRLAPAVLRQRVVMTHG